MISYCEICTQCCLVIATNLFWSAPSSLSTNLPLLNSKNVGIACISYFSAISGPSSTSTLIRWTLKWELNPSKTGAIFLHGPHQVALKSTRTGYCVCFNLRSNNDIEGLEWWIWHRESDVWSRRGNHWFWQRRSLHLGSHIVGRLEENNFRSSTGLD